MEWRRTGRPIGAGRRAPNECDIERDTDVTDVYRWITTSISRWRNGRRRRRRRRRPETTLEPNGTELVTTGTCFRRGISDMQMRRLNGYHRPSFWLLVCISIRAESRRSSQTSTSYSGHWLDIGHFS